MSIHTSGYAAGDVIGGFTVVSVTEIADLKAEGIHLKHRTTGLEAFHLYTDDEENLFSFSFMTPPSDSTGVAHILEHSVLCGSKNYPLKDQSPAKLSKREHVSKRDDLPG